MLLTADVKVVGSRQLTIPANKISPELFIVRMTLRYDRNPSAAEGEDVAKRVFYVREAKAVFYYHFGKSQISGTLLFVYFLLALLIKLHDGSIKVM